MYSLYSFLDCANIFGEKRTSNIFATLELLLPKDLIHLIQYYDLNFILYKKESKLKAHGKLIIHYKQNIYLITSTNKNLKSSRLIDITTSESLDISFWGLSY